MSKQKILKFERPMKRKTKVKAKKKHEKCKYAKLTPVQHKELAEKLEVERHKTVTKFMREAASQHLNEEDVARLSGIRSVQTVKRLWTFETVEPRDSTLLKMAWGLGLQRNYMSPKKAAALKHGRAKLQIS